MSILPKIIRENSVLRSSQNTRAYIMKQSNPREAANDIIKELGVAKYIPSLYDARITAMNMVSDYIRFGSEFDHEASFEHGMSRAHLLRKEYPYFAKEEDKMDSAIDNVNVTNNDNAAVAIVKAPVKAKRKAKEKAVVTKEEVVAEVVVRSAKKSKRDIARDIYLANKEAPSKMIVDLIAETLQTTKSNAYVYLYHVKKEQ